jgi:hypothetical protein
MARITRRGVLAGAASAGLAQSTAAKGLCLGNANAIGILKGVTMPELFAFARGGSPAGSQFSTHYASWALAMPSALKTALLAAGCNTIRLAVDPLPFLVAANDAAINTLLAQTLVAVDDLLASGFKVIYDIHVLPSPTVIAGWGRSDLVDGPSGPQFSRLVHCSQIIAAALATRPSGRVIGEIYNEWAPVATFSGLTPQITQLNYLYDQWRAVAPGLPLAVSCMNAGDVGTLVTTPFDPSHFDTNTYIVVHDYSPAAFTIQDLPGYTQYINRLQFPPGSGGQTHSSELANATAFVNADTSLTSGQKTADISAIDTLLTPYFSTPQNASWLQTTRMGPAAAWADANGVARYRMLLGEFGCVGDPSSDNMRSYVSPPSGGLGGDAVSRAAYYAAVTQGCKSLGASFCVFDLMNDYFEITPGTQVLDPTLAAAIFS